MIINICVIYNRYTLAIVTYANKDYVTCIGHTGILITVTANTNANKILPTGNFTFARCSNSHYYSQRTLSWRENH